MHVTFGLKDLKAKQKQAVLLYSMLSSHDERQDSVAHFSVCCRSLIDFLPRMSSMRLVPDCGLGSGLGPGAANGGGGPVRPRCLLCGGGGPAGTAAARLEGSWQVEGSE